MSTICKFKCESVTLNEAWASISLVPVTNSNAENKKFFQYTPGGKIDLQIVSLETAKQFEPGKEYFINISQA